MTSWWRRGWRIGARGRGGRLRPCGGQRRDNVEIDPTFMRPAEVEHLVGDSSKARRVLGWQPRTSFEDMIRSMVDADYKLLSRGGRPPAAGAEPLI